MAYTPGNVPYIIVPLLAVAAFGYYRNCLSGLVLLVIGGAIVSGLRKLIRKRGSKASHTQRDLIELLTGISWVILLAIGFLFMIFNGIKHGTVVYCFKYVMGDGIMAGRYLIALLLISMVAALATSGISRLADMIKTGGGLARSRVLLVLAGYGTDEPTIEGVTPGPTLLMSWIRAAFSAFAALVMLLYPLNEAKMAAIEQNLAEHRQQPAA